MTRRPPVRILLDVNVLVSDILGRAAGRKDTTSQKLVDAMLAGTLGGREVQLVLSVGMLDTFQDVLIRLGSPPGAADAAREALLDLVRHGPDGLDPFLLLDRSDSAFAIRDREDAAVLATAFAARADLLVTDNLADFESGDCIKIATSRARHADGSDRQLFRLLCRVPGGHSLVVAHPLDIVARARQGQSILFDDLAGH